METRLLSLNEIPEAVKVARGVFNYCLRPGIADTESIRLFEEYTTVDNLTALMSQGDMFMWGIYEQGHLVAMSAMLKGGHITMLYVLPYFQRHRYGKELLHTMRVYANQKLNLTWVTVNAMPAWTANYFYKQKFTGMLSQPQAQGQFAALCAKTIPEVSFEPKEFSQGWVIGVTVAGIALCLGFGVYYAASLVGLI